MQPGHDFVLIHFLEDSPEFFFLPTIKVRFEIILNVAHFLALTLFLRGNSSDLILLR